MAKLTAGDPQKNPRALLRNALPISNKPVREAQLALESISEDLRVPGVRWSGVSSTLSTCKRVVTSGKAELLTDVAPSKQAGAWSNSTTSCRSIPGSISKPGRRACAVLLLSPPRE